jgi:hypothetical protein
MPQHVLPAKRKNPEGKIQKDIKDFLTLRGWYVMVTHGNMFQKGFPDLYATHSVYGPRWIEVKLPQMKGSQWTRAQLECFPKLAAHGTKIWIMTAATEKEYALLKHPCNLHKYMVPK